MLTTRPKRSRRRPEKGEAIRDSMTSPASWLCCYRCWSQNVEVQVHYEGIFKVDAQAGKADEVVEEKQEAVVQ